jgi:hypothetical protein
VTANSQRIGSEDETTRVRIQVGRATSQNSLVVSRPGGRIQSCGWSLGVSHAASRQTKSVEDAPGAGRLDA